MYLESAYILSFGAKMPFLSKVWHIWAVENGQIILRTLIWWNVIFMAEYFDCDFG